jgi:hypothetical protein|tara:strand:+ start:483 stop:896 length:414 start_codon:yes stop_codon:yes gene_type:complete
MNKLINAFVIYKFIRLLVTPFDKTDAFKLGIIDDKGNYLKKQKDLETKQEKLASNIFTRLVFNIKKLLAKVPGGSSRLGSFAAALYLIREEAEKIGADGDLVEEAFFDHVKRNHNLDIKEDLLEYRESKDGMWLRKE